jgi:hypothetical protein
MNRDTRKSAMLSRLMTPALVLVLACLNLASCASGPSVSQPASLRSVWFTDRDFPPGYQQYRSEFPEQYYGPGKSQPEKGFAFDPELGAMVVTTGGFGPFEKASGRSVKMVLVMKDCDSHEFAIRRADPGGKETSGKWSVSSLLRERCSWRVTYRTWQVNSLAVGEHTVDLTVDGKPGGTYKFTVR